MINIRILEARKARRLSQTALATLLGVQQPSVSEWETGRSEPAMVNLTGLAVVLGVNFEWLATGRGQRDYQTDMQTGREQEYVLRSELREWMELYGRLTPTCRDAVFQLVQVFEGKNQAQ